MSSFEEVGGQEIEGLPLNLLIAVDWCVQAEGFALMYEQTGDTDYLVMEIEARGNAATKARFYRELFEL